MHVPKQANERGVIIKTQHSMKMFALMCHFHHVDVHMYI